jgi:glycerate kinase
MKIVVAPQALKGSLDAPDVGVVIAAALAEALPAAQVIITPVADGGEGTTRALIDATNGRLLTAQRPARRPHAGDVGHTRRG